MRPTPNELIERVRAILRDVVEPEVGSEYARSRLTEVRAVLASVDWDDAGLSLARDNIRVRSILSPYRALIEVTLRRAGLDVSRAELARPSMPTVEPQTFEAARAESDALAQLIVDLITPLSSNAAAGEGSLEDGSRLLDELAEHLAR